MVAAWRLERTALARLRILLVMLFVLVLPAPEIGATGVSASHPLAPLVRAQLEQATDGALTLPDGSRFLPGEVVARFYAQRGYAPAWDRPARFDALVAALASVSGDGLRPADYLADTLPRLRAAAKDSEARVQLDILATRMLMEAIAHVHSGKLDSERERPDWRIANRPTASDEWLAAIHAAALDGEVAALIERARPNHRAYRSLRNGLRELRAIAAAGGWTKVPPGPALQPGTSDTRVLALRTRLAQAGIPAVPAGAGERYDDTLAHAVRQFQREQHLAADGVVGPATLAALNEPVEARIEQLRANLERARWLLRDLPADFVLVDIAGYRITYFRESKPVWNSRVQVGLPYRSTPMLRSQITYFTFNPTWTIPPTILREDVLPKVREDLGYLERNQIRVVQSGGEELDPYWIDWEEPPGDVLLRQDAGPANPLGRVAIRFPNRYAVYLHDTPNKRLFERDRRAVSSGCIRVENPLELVELLFDDPGRWNRAAIEARIDSGRTVDVGLERPVPILILYWTADALPDGRIAFKRDIYGRDGPLLEALAAPRP